MELDERRLSARPSVTAQRVARRRAVHQLLDQPLILDDPVALPILGAEERAWLESDIQRRFPPSRETMPMARALRAFMVARSRFAEDGVADAVARGVRQYVVLGAGLDTFAYRNRFASLDIFEVDHPSTQAWKRQRLDAARILVPAEAARVAYVPVDLDRQSLGRELATAGFRADEAAVFSWLGVTMYLAPESVWEVLRFVANLPAGSSIAFDYAIAREHLGILQRAVFDRLAARVASAGEPWTAFFDPPALERGVRDLSLTKVEHLDGAQINERYFANRDDGLRVGTLARLMRAGS